eukprot:scaffold1206_cov184-Ochromonas_danica.AAC.2
MDKSTKDLEFPGTRYAPLNKFANSVEGKIAVAKNFLESGKTYKEYGNAHSIALTTLKNWVKKYRQLLSTEVNTFYAKGGRPRAIDQEGLDSIRQIIVEASEQQKPLGKREIRKVVQEHAEATQKRRNIAAPAVTLSSKTITRCIVEVNAVEIVGQSKTNALIVAENDSRNA